jgi:hypothetical protein
MKKRRWVENPAQYLVRVLKKLHGILEFWAQN